MHASSVERALSSILGVVMLTFACFVEVVIVYHIGGIYAAVAIWLAVNAGRLVLG